MQHVIDVSDGFHGYVVPRLKVMRGNSIQFQRLNTFLDDWVKRRDGGPLAMLGDYGVGKSSACLYIAHRMANAFCRHPHSALIPVIVPLRTYADGSSLAIDIDAISSDLELGLSKQTLAVLGNQGRLVLLLDGFDEMSQTASPQVALDALRRLRGLVGDDSRTLLTCRTHYFASAGHIDDVLTGRVPGTDLLSLFRDYAPRFSLVELQDFSPAESLAAISKAVPPGEAQTVREELSEVYDLKDLARRPILLKLMLATLSRIREEQAAGRLVNSTTLYALYVDYCLRRELFHGPSFTTTEARVDFVSRLAVEMFASERQTITYAELGQKVRDAHPDEPGGDRVIDNREYDARSKSFLIRDGDGNYRFMHRSFQEYFVAVRCLDELEEMASPMETWGIRWFDQEVSGFIAGGLAGPVCDKRLETLLEICAEGRDRVVLWNALHVLSLLPFATLRGHGRLLAVRAILARSADEQNAVLLRQYARICAKFIGAEQGRKVIDRVLDIVHDSSAEEGENTETYVRYYRGRRAAIDALFAHLSADTLKYDYRLHLHVLGALAELKDAFRLEKMAVQWTGQARRDARAAFTAACERCSNEHAASARRR